jgi:hypothetical protein
VTFELPHDVALLSIPASALIFDQNGLQVATIDARNRVVLKSISIARDHGATLEIASGLTADDRVVETPPDGILAGSEVRIVETAAPKTAAAKSGNEKRGNEKS